MIKKKEYRVRGLYKVFRVKKYTLKEIRKLRKTFPSLRFIAVKKRRK